MTLQKIIGYIVSIIGIIILAISSERGNAIIPLSKIIPQKYALIIGLVIIVIGVIILSISNKGKTSSSKQKPEVPIYEGKGKKRRLVGYQRED